MSQIDNPVVIYMLRFLIQDISQLFSDPPSCLMIYRILPEVSKNLILRIINSTKNGSIESSEIKNHDIFINTEKNIGPYCVGLRQLKIIKEDFTLSNIQFNQVFIATMKKILTEGIENEENIEFHRKPKGYENSLERGVNRLYKFMNEKIFNQLGKPKTDNYINNFLTKKNCLHLVGNTYELGPSSYTLFLSSTEDMLKRFFNLYLSFWNEKNKNNEKKMKFVKFLFYLTTLEPGAYFTEFPQKYYDPSFEEQIDFMTQIGFLNVKQEKTDGKNNVKRYYTTPLIQCLFENNNISKSYSKLKYGDENAERFLFVETNMKFYAYMPYVQNSSKNRDSLNSSLNLSSCASSTSLSTKDEEKVQDQKTKFNFNLFKTIFSIEMQLPNMLIGYITRECLKKLFKDVKSPLILKFLSDRMSLKSDDVTEVGGKKYLINESVVNQILVLEREKKSIVTKQAFCYYNFYDREQFNRCMETINEQNIDCIYSTNDVLVCSADSSENKKKAEILDNLLNVELNRKVK